MSSLLSDLADFLGNWRSEAVHTACFSVISWCLNSLVCCCWQAALLSSCNGYGAHDRAGPAHVTGHVTPSRQSGHNRPLQLALIVHPVGRQLVMKSGPIHRRRHRLALHEHAHSGERCGCCDLWPAGGTNNQPCSPAGRVQKNGWAHRGQWAFPRSHAIGCRRRQTVVVGEAGKGKVVHLVVENDAGGGG